MPIRAKCRQCGRTYQVKDKFAGQVLPCKECGGRFRVPEPEPEPVEALDFLDEDDLLDDDGFDEPTPSRKPKRRRRPAAAADPWEDEFGDAGGGSGGGARPARKRRPPGAAPERPSRGSARPSARRPPSPDAPVRGGKPSRGGKPGRSKRRAKPPGLLDDATFRYAAVGAIALLILATFGWMVWSRSAGAGGAAEAGADGRFNVAAVAVPQFPEPGPPRPLPSGVTMHEVRLAGVPGNGGAPGQSMRMRVYLPPGDHPAGSLGCVLVPPAGTNLLVGSDIDDGSYHDESLPYAQAGFAVVHYSLDGPADLDNPNDAAIAAAYKKFRDACAGVVNARNALEFVLARLPQVDPQRIYSAGHSSAGTLSLLFAAHEPRLAGCIAYAPAADVELRLGDVADDFSVRRLLPGVGEFIRQSSPKTHAAQIKCPVFLFHARDDSNEPFTTTEAFGKQLKDLGKDVTVKLVPTGDHYDSMIHEGIPAAITWLERRPENQKRGQGQNSAQPTPDPTPQAGPSPQVSPSPRPNPSFQPSAPPTAGGFEPPMASHNGPHGQPPGPTPPNGPAQPLGDTGPPPPPGIPVVVLELKGYDGSLPPQAAAMTALQGVPWVRMPFVRIEGSQSRLIIGVRGGAVNTGQAKSALQSSGFQIGGAAYHGSGL